MLRAEQTHPALGLVASLPRAAGLLRDPVPVYFSFLLAVALIHLQALNAFPAAHMR